MRARPRPAPAALAWLTSVLSGDRHQENGHDGHDALRARVRRLCEAVIAPRAAATDRSGEFPVDCYEALRDNNFHAPRVARDYGGTGADATAAAIVVEELARASATCALIPAINDLGVHVLQSAASEDLRRAYLPRIARGEGMISFCLSEPQAGSDIAAMSTRADRIAGGYVLRGIKSWITHAGLADYYVVFAVTGTARSVSCFLVERGDPGLCFGRLERKLGITGSPTREVFLDDVHVPARRRIGAPGHGLRIALGALDHSRVAIAAQAVGIAAGALQYVISHQRNQITHDRTPEVGQATGFALADMAMRVAAARSLTYAAAARSQANAADLTFFASAAKTFASDVAMSVTSDAVELLGTDGVGPRCPVERMMRDAKVTQIYEGTNQIQRVIIARSLLGTGHD